MPMNTILQASYMRHCHVTLQACLQLHKGSWRCKESAGGKLLDSGVAQGLIGGEANGGRGERLGGASSRETGWDPLRQATPAVSIE